MPNSAAISTVGDIARETAGGIAWLRRSDVDPVYAKTTEYASPAENSRSRAGVAKQRYAHRPAVVLSRSQAVRKSLQNALLARGAAVANLRALPAFRQIEDLLASGLILLAPPDDRLQGDAADWIAVPTSASVDQSVNGALLDLERRGVLASRDLIFPGEGI